DANWLRLESVESRVHDALSVLGHHRRRNSNDGSRTHHWISPQLMQSIHAANTRKLDVHQNECRLLLVSKADAFFTGFRRDDLVAFDLQRISYQLHAGGIVFDDEDQLIRHDAPVS